ncbi:MAG TPA: NAD-dependent epimerase/dehydratase family protein [Flavobacteriales bacterium]|nr:NAD-dependent epimerase/dehydratase family protein [Flavobacteriales bacterium]
MVLVTGGTGLLGARIIFDLVNAGVEVCALKRSSSDLSIIEATFGFYESESGQNNYGAINWVEGDITDVTSLNAAMEGVNKVYHCAAMVSFHPKVRDRMMHVNIQGTANVVNACIDSAVKKLCFASSVASLGRNENGNPTTEDTPWKVGAENSNYSISKYAAEQEVWRGSEEGLDMVIVNPTIIIGPGNWKKSSARMFLNVWRGLDYYTSGQNGFVDIRDVSKAMIALTDSELKSERFLLNAENLPFKDVFDWIADSLGKKRPAVKVSKLMSEIFWRLDKLKSMLTGTKRSVTREIARESSKVHTYSSEKIRKEIGLEFIPIKKSIEDTGKIFLTQVKTT